jgi:hypothetical protein
LGSRRRHARQPCGGREGRSARNKLTKVSEDHATGGRDPNLFPWPQPHESGPRLSTPQSLDFTDGSVAGIIGADGADEHGRPTQSMEIDGDVEGRTAKIRTIGQQIPEEFTDRDDRPRAQIPARRAVPRESGPRSPRRIVPPHRCLRIQASPTTRRDGEPVDRRTGEEQPQVARQSDRTAPAVTDPGRCTSQSRLSGAGAAAY